MVVDETLLDRHRMAPAADGICLDDSAMRREVALDHGIYDKEAVIERVRSLFKPYLYIP